MKNFSSIALAFLVGLMAGAYMDNYYMSNDEEYREYWLKRLKKPE